LALRAVPHLNFTGNAREALGFYHAVFGGQLMIGTYGEGGVPQDSPTSDQVTFVPVAADSPDAELVSFGLVAAENGFRLAAYDVVGTDGGGVAGRSGGSVRRAEALTHSEAVFVLLDGDTLDEVRPAWTGLAEGGTVIQALAPTPWGSPYGMLTDRFGVTWIIGASA
jgi:PhnB protein